MVVHHVVTLLSLLLTATQAPTAAGTALGALKLDNYTLDKALAIPAHSILVKIDKSYAYGEKEDEFKTLAKLAYSVPKFLVAEVPVQEYGDKDNDDIRERFNLNKDDFPVYMLFNQANKDGLKYTGNIKAEDLAVWLRKSGVKMPSIGTIVELDEIVENFLVSKSAEHIAAARALAEGDYKNDRKASMYVKIMEKVKDKGDDYITTESARVVKILEGKISVEKREEMGDKLKVLGAFAKDA